MTNRRERPVYRSVGRAPNASEGGWPNRPLVAIEPRAAVAWSERVRKGELSMVTEFVVTAGETPKRLDIFLVNREPKLSRSALQRLIGQGRVAASR